MTKTAIAMLVVSGTIVGIGLTIFVNEMAYRIHNASDESVRVAVPLTVLPHQEMLDTENDKIKSEIENGKYWAICEKKGDPGPKEFKPKATINVLVADGVAQRLYRGVILKIDGDLYTVRFQSIDIKHRRDYVYDSRGRLATAWLQREPQPILTAQFFVNELSTPYELIQSANADGAAWQTYKVYYPYIDWKIVNNNVFGECFDVGNQR